jgi:hypothetical protein
VEVKMGIYDIIWMVMIVAGALYLLYRSVWKKKGLCAGCSAGSCGMVKKYNAKEC